MNTHERLARTPPTVTALACVAPPVKGVSVLVDVKLAGIVPEARSGVVVGAAGSCDSRVNVVSRRYGNR